ncbi:hypothetical protein PspLS_11230, partial [Pyricularia sp. CBS 133598]
MVLSGRPHERLLELHKKYGETVRVAPNELSFINPEAWPEVMGHRSSQALENNKDPHYVDPSSGTMISADKPDHERMRGILNTAFSPQAQREQAPVIEGHVEHLINRLDGFCGQDGECNVNLVQWYHFALFDIVSDLTLGEPFGCLKAAEYHPWVNFILSRANLGAYVRTILRLPGSTTLLKLIVPRSIIKQADEHLEQTFKMVNRRFGRVPAHPDIFTAMVQGKGDLKMTKQEICTNTEVLIMGGSETTASALCAATFFLVTNQEVMSRTVQEITATFSATSEIDLYSVSKLTYLEAVIKESIRLYPPAPNALPRKTPPEGNVICGDFIPGSTILGLWQWTINRSTVNFKFPNEFHPERWLGSSEFTQDRKAAFQPFSYGNRNCIGQRIAMAELRLIMARMLWSFEIELELESKAWLDQDVFTLWNKKPLNVILNRRKA